MSKTFGFDLLRAQVVQQLEDEMAHTIASAVGDTEIERLFHASLVCLCTYCRVEYEFVLTLNRAPEARQTIFDMDQSKRGLVLESQVQIDSARVDFVVYAWTFGRVRHGPRTCEQGDPRWRKLVVECDGHDFHERTKEQAKHDRSRDRDLVQRGYDVFRFTGSELWRDPLGCADQVHQWALKGFG